MNITIYLNGQDVRQEACTLAELVTARGLASGSLVIEHNGRIIPQQDWPKVRLRPDDVLEMLNFVGGG
jgi:thiamine biosynthesis protein ThiS